MLVTVPGYRVQEQIYSSSRTEVYRATRDSDQKPVVIKLMNSDYPSFNELVQFRNQYAIAVNLDLPGVVRAYSLERYRNGYALVMEDMGGISLKEYAEKGVLSICEFLPIAISIVSTLVQLYQNRVIHKDIKPANLLINPTTKQVKLIDFSISSLLPRETQEIASANVLEGTLAYISPEQTGRMNRGIDYRTDFYSLGVTFYELLTGQLPFDSEDPMELVHCHIAQQPPDVNSVNPDIPPVISSIIAKLMAKMAEDRYQSALGLKHDLECCLQMWKASGRIDEFQLGLRDIPDRFTIPEKLYGRELEVETLLAAFDRVSAGKAEMMLVAGFSGIGKTAVVNEVHKPIVRQRGYFIKGKFDQFQRNIPFSALVQAFRDLMGQLLSESDAELQEWKANILSALGENAQVIVEVIPELEGIIGKQPPVPELTGSAAQNRFNLLLQKFIRVFTTKEHPLVIFIDDLQWADNASLNLMELLMSDTDSSYLLFLGAYRDNEVSPDHPLVLTLEEISKAGAIVNSITLDPLDEAATNHLVADTLSCGLALAKPLTDLVMTKTKGNPFFSTQFLKYLHEDGPIAFNFEEGYWQCDLALLKAMAITDDVVEFMASRLHKLPKETQDVLQLAACIGNQFDLATLAIVQEKSPAETAADLWKALQEGLILPKSQTYKFFQEQTSGDVGETDHLASVSYRFLHDRVQQAAYFSIDPDNKQATHLQIGRLLLANIAPSAREEHIFDIVNQLNMGVDLLAEQTERDELSQLNLIAGRKAKASTAYAGAVRYLTLGMELLATDSWQTQYDLTFALHKERADAEYLTGNFQKSAALIDMILKEGKSNLERAEIYNLTIVHNTLMAKYADAIAVGRKALALVGIDLPPSDSIPALDLELAQAQANLGDRPIASLLEQEETTDPEKIVAQKLLGNLAAPTFFSNQDLFGIVTVKSVNLSLKSGHVPESALSYANYGLILVSRFGDYRSGYEFGQLALKLSDRFNEPSVKCKVSLVFGDELNSWMRHLKWADRIFKDGYKAGLESGEFQWAGYILMYQVLNAFYLEKNLESFQTDIGKFLLFNQKTQNQLAADVMLAAQLITQNLRGMTAGKLQFALAEISEAEYLKNCQEQQSFVGLCAYHIFKAQVLYLYGEYAQALNSIGSASEILVFLQSTILIAECKFYHSLILIALYPFASSAEQKQYWQQVSANQNQMQIWAENCPDNFQHAYLLVAAEIARLTGKDNEAMDLYDRAIAEARANEFIQNEALANELAARFWLEKGKEKIAGVYLTDAYYDYAHWGAKAKLDQLEQHYPQLLGSIVSRNIGLAPWATVTSMTAATITRTSTTGSAILDWATVMKAAQAISGVLDLEELLSTLMQVVMENAGASAGALMLLKEGQLVIEASALRVNAKESNGKVAATVMRSLPVSQSPDIPVTAINFVKYTHKTLVINDVTVEKMLAGDPYIIRTQPKSILCTPIINQGKFLGILYLENHLTTRSFTGDRVEVLNLLCAQAAIALENATLYHNLQESEAREREKAEQLAQSLSELEQAQLQLVQSEKMATLGQLAAGVAHEINNPVSFIVGNLDHAKQYTQDLINHLQLYQQHIHPGEEILTHAEAIDLEFVLEDLPDMISSMQEGTDRIREISKSMRTFARSDTAQKVAFNIHDGIDSTLLILKHRLKANQQRPAIEILKEYGQLPEVMCYPGQLNQVFMNLIANAIDAFDEFNARRDYNEIKTNPNLIVISTQVNQSDRQAIIRIKDNGPGMPSSVKQRIFDHLFTTKAVGKGTGLGLSISRQIVVEKHGGQMDCNSAPGVGTEFAIALPLDH